MSENQAPPNPDPVEAWVDNCVAYLTNSGLTEDVARTACRAVLGDLKPMPLDGAASKTAKLAVSEIASADPAVTPEAFVKYYVAEQKSLKNGDVEAYVSTEDVDRAGDIMKASGWSLGNFKKSGSPVLFGHHRSITPGGHIPLIGNAVEMEIQRKGLWSVTRFHEKTQLSREAAVLAREKLMPSWSVGFIALERPKASEYGGLVFNRQELLEYSLVPIAENQEALSKAYDMAKRGLISRQTAYDFAGPSPSILAGPMPLSEVDSGQPESVKANAEAGQALVKALHARTALLALRAGARK